MARHSTGPPRRRGPSGSAGGRHGRDHSQAQAGMGRTGSVSLENRGVSQVVYILAASHSGSTLLAMLLGRQSELCSVGELKATSLGDPSRYRCSCGALIRECRFWRAVSDEMRARGFEYEVTNAGTDFRSGMPPHVNRLLQPLHRGPLLETVRDAALSLSPAWRAGRPRIQQRNKALVESILKLTGKKAVVDSSKIGIRLKYLMRTPGLDVKVVRLIRDGRGVALTYMDPAQFADARDPRLKQGGMGGDRAHQRLSVERAAREWRRSTEEADAIVRGLKPDQVIQVQYEELCAQPEETVARICGRLGVAVDDVDLDFRAIEHHVVGNGMRLDSTIEIEQDTRWQRVLTRGDLQVFDAIAGPINRRFGYQ